MGMAEAQQGKDVPGVVAPPPLIYLNGLIGGLLLDRIVPVVFVPGYPIAGAVLAGLGVILMALGIREFKRTKTEYLPYKPTARIISSGPFRFTRNPLYLSMSLIYAGLAIAFASAWALVLFIPVLATIRYGVIGREERYLERKFGAEYLGYKNSVRRWI